MNTSRVTPPAELIEELARLCRNGRDGVLRSVEPTGSERLDAVLPGGGWQSGTIVELMPMSMGIGELRLLMPREASVMWR
jgi:protein ImuA